MIMALLLLAACAAFGMSALSAARADAERYSYLTKYQREYLSVSSAARLLKEQLSGLEITAEYIYMPEYEFTPEEALEGGGLGFGEIKDVSVSFSYSFGGLPQPQEGSVLRLISDGICEAAWERFVKTELGGSGWLKAEEKYPASVGERSYEITVEVPDDGAFAAVEGVITVREDRISVTLEAESGSYALGFDAPMRFGTAVFERSEEYLDPRDPLSLPRIKEGRAKFTVFINAEFSEIEKRRET